MVANIGLILVQLRYMYMSCPVTANMEHGLTQKGPILVKYGRINKGLPTYSQYGSNMDIPNTGLLTEVPYGSNMRNL